jgi:omega-6 fatty acid desaturase (delta-12 desaturase)
MVEVMVVETLSGTLDTRTSVLCSKHWRKLVARFQVSSARRALWQLINSVIPYMLLWIGMVYALAESYWLMLPIAILASGFLVRIFIIFHDCGHESFFRTRRANHLTGAVTGLLTLTPYLHWRWHHALHHKTAGNLDTRGVGDIWTLTVEEYLGSSRWKRLGYRLARNPLILFVVVPFYIFILAQRLHSGIAPSRERRSVHLTNLAIALAALSMSALVGLKAFLLIQLTVSTIAGGAGIWLFYVQHQFEGAYWQRANNWNYTAAALEGSSFYKLPRILQWFSGNIGFHHVHHLSPRIPNYNLQRCHEANSLSLFRRITPITLIASMKSLTFRLWDETRQMYVGF